MVIINELNNREIASIIWLTLFLIYLLTLSGVRQSIPGLMKGFINTLFFPITIMLFYISALVFLLFTIGFWDITALKDTILWIFGTAFVTFFNLSKIGEDEKYFKKLLKDNLKLIIILEFITNLYTFSLLAELIILPILSFLLIVNNLAELKPEYKQVTRFFNFLLGMFGIFIIIFSIKEVYMDFQSFASIKNLRDFLLPPLFLLLLIPFLYFLALYFQYRWLFKFISFANKNSDLSKYAKRKVFTTCHFNLFKLTRVSKKIGYPKVIEENDVLDWINIKNM